MAASFGAQLAFARWFAYYSGLNGNVILAWCLQEQPPGSPATPGSNNWLNIQYTDSGPNATYYEIARLPVQAAAKASVDWMGRNQPSILAARGKSAYDQAAAIVNSGWASSHYGGVATFYREVQAVETSTVVGSVKAGTAPALPSLAGVKGSVAAGVTPAQTHSTVEGHSWHEHIKQAGKQAGEHGTTIQRISAGLSGIAGRYRR